MGTTTAASTASAIARYIILRFQQAIQQLHTGTEVPWSELALNCGFYDQSHFANEFRAFSGVDVTTYSARRTQWANNIAVE